jgi:hypothetical protein
MIRRLFDLTSLLYAIILVFVAVLCLYWYDNVNDD